MILVYIAGPFRGPNAWEIEQNVRGAEAAAYEVWSHGMAALCPHANTRFFDGTNTDDLYLDGTLEMLRRCDALYSFSERRGESEGTKSETAEARRLGIPVFETLDALLGWRRLVNAS